MIKKIIFFFLITIVITPFALVYFGNVSPKIPSESPLSESDIQNQSKFFKKSEAHVHQLFLNGNAFQRGQQYGYWTESFLQQQESALLKKLNEVIPSTFLQHSLMLFSMGWFYGLENHFEKDWLDEMYGVSLYGSKEDLFFATPYTRQMAYHGIHDMGQMMIDQGLVLGACTQILSPLHSGWLIGRNFDFEGGRVFDTDKVLKWVFPEKGEAFVSIIFSGMVGVITGINQKGVYVAINAAGSEDFTRLGTPTTLVALKALQFSKSAKEAIEIIKSSKPLITEIFVVADKGPTAYIVEKTPKRIEILQRDSKSVVTNHLQHPNWKNDRINEKRKNSNTTVARYDRAQELLEGANSTPEDFLQILRDKVVIDNRVAHGHRASIDAMIASHSIIYNSKEDLLYVSKGPSLSKEFIGIDLAQTFTSQRPQFVKNLPKDSSLQGKDFWSLKAKLKQLRQSIAQAKKKECELARNTLFEDSEGLFASHYLWHWAQAELSLCLKDKKKALSSFQQALNLEPAYQQERETIREQIEKL